MSSADRGATALRNRYLARPTSINRSGVQRFFVARPSNTKHSHHVAIMAVQAGDFNARRSNDAVRKIVSFIDDHFTKRVKLCIGRVKLLSSLATA